MTKCRLCDEEQPILAEYMCDICWKYVQDRKRRVANQNLKDIFEYKEEKDE